LGGKADIWLQLTGDNQKEIQEKWASSVTSENFFPVNMRLVPIWSLLEHKDADYTKAEELQKYMKQYWAKSKAEVPEYHYAPEKRQPTLTAVFTESCNKSYQQSALGGAEIHCEVNQFSCGVGTHASDDSKCEVNEARTQVRACFVDRCWKRDAWKCSSWGTESTHNFWGTAKCKLQPRPAQYLTASFTKACQKSVQQLALGGAEIHCKVNQFSCGPGTHASDDTKCQVNEAGTQVRACFVDRCWSRDAWKCSAWGANATHNFWGNTQCRMTLRP